jgi:hypothetical protein
MAPFSMPIVTVKIAKISPIAWIRPGQAKSELNHLAAEQYCYPRSIDWNRVKKTIKLASRWQQKLAYLPLPHIYLSLAALRLLNQSPKANDLHSSKNRDELAGFDSQPSLILHSLTGVMCID